jgi:hypothetical protein
MPILSITSLLLLLISFNAKKRMAIQIKKPRERRMSDTGEYLATIDLSGSHYLGVLSL